MMEFTLLRCAQDKVFLAQPFIQKGRFRSA